MPVEFKEYYGALGVRRGPPQEERQRAFRGLARKCQPDQAKDGTKASSGERFQEVGQAYEGLEAPEQRRKYDRRSADRGQSGRGPCTRPGYVLGGARRSSPQRGFEAPLGGPGFSDFSSVSLEGLERIHLPGTVAMKRCVSPSGADLEAELLVALRCMKLEATDLWKLNAAN